MYDERCKHGNFINDPSPCNACENERIETVPGSQTNQMIRVLQGQAQRLKFTIRVHQPGGKIIEWQADDTPKMDWNAEARQLWLREGCYDGPPIMAWTDGSILLCEENPEFKKKP